MATFNIVLDTRVKKKNDNYNLSLRVINGNETMFIPITKLTTKQYDLIFIKKSLNQDCIDFRIRCNELISKGEKIYNTLKPFNKVEFRRLFNLVDEEPSIDKNSLLLKDLFQIYINDNKTIKRGTRNRYKTSMNVFETFKPGYSVFDVTVKYLTEFERVKSATCSIPTISSYMRDLRSILNYFLKEVVRIPKTYEYPFGRGKYTIKNHNPKKIVMKNHEIQNVVEFNDFDSPQQEYARDVWLFLYRCNGINFADLLRMRWDNIKGDCFIFHRKKTETTRRNNVKEIVAPISEKVQILVDKIGVKNSPFLLGKLKEGYTESTFSNKSHKLRQTLNRELTKISVILNLSVPLKLKTARDTYATTLKRAGVGNNVIGEMMGHANSTITEHYLDSLDTERTFAINDVLF